jgi:hypothetical protein
VIYLSDAVLTPSLWQQVCPMLHVIASYVPAYVVICFMFPKEVIR